MVESQTYKELSCTNPFYYYYYFIRRVGVVQDRSRRINENDFNEIILKRILFFSFYCLLCTYFNHNESCSDSKAT